MEPYRIDDLVRAQSAVWDNFFEAGGWGMYPTALFGFMMLLTACLFIFRPENRFLPTIVTLGILTAVSGVLATVTGLKIGFTYVQFVDPAVAAQVAAKAASDSFSNAVFSFSLINLGAIATLVGIVRQTRHLTP